MPIKRLSFLRRQPTHENLSWHNRSRRYMATHSYFNTTNLSRKNESDCGIFDFQMTDLPQLPIKIIQKILRRPSLAVVARFVSQDFADYHDDWDEMMESLMMAPAIDDENVLNRQIWRPCLKDLSWQKKSLKSLHFVILRCQNVRIIKMFLAESTYSDDPTSLENHLDYLSLDKCRYHFQDTELFERIFWHYKIRFLLMAINVAAIRIYDKIVA